MNYPRRQTEERGLVFDLGGTTSRAGLYSTAGVGKLLKMVRKPTPSFLSHPGRDLKALQSNLLTTLDQLAKALPRKDARWIAAAIAGPVSPQGMVQRAPSLWGSARQPWDLQSILNQRFRLPVTVINDVTAAATYFGRQPKYRAYRTIGVLTVSTGLGFKVFDTRRGECLINRHGYGGEIGHLPVATPGNASLCSCGQPGHMNTLSSGRGAKQMAQYLTQTQPALFRRSKIFKKTSGDANRIQVETLSSLAKTPNDPFLQEFLAQVTEPIAQLIRTLVLALGVEKFVIMGGVAGAIGAPFKEALVAHLQSRGLYGRTPRQVESLVDLATPRDDYGLLGAGIVAMAQFGGRRAHANNGEPIDRMQAPSQSSRAIGGRIAPET